MPASSLKVKRKRQNQVTLTSQEALDFAQLILDIYKVKKES
jgi:hypothetical protein